MVTIVSDVSVASNDRAIATFIGVKLYYSMLVDITDRTISSCMQKAHYDSCLHFYIADQLASPYSLLYKPHEFFNGEKNSLELGGVPAPTALFHIWICLFSCEIS